MDMLRWVVLLAALVTVGLMAGTFFIYAVAVMPGLRRTDDRTFVSAFQAIDRAVINPTFLATFMGALLLNVAAVPLFWAGQTRSLLPWLIVSAVLYLVVVVITVRVNVPRNDAIKAAGHPDQIDLPAVRGSFDELRWARWNIVRTVLSTATLGCLACAVALYSRVAG